MLNYLEIVGTIIGLLYLYFEYKASIYLWLMSILMPMIYIFVYYDAGFYADMGINIYYLGASIYGWAVWLGGRSIKREVKMVRNIEHTPLKYILPMVVIAGVLFFAIAQLLINFTDSTVPWGDSFTTALSIIAMWMLSRKYVEQWLVWLVVDVVCTGLYLYKGLYPTAALYGLYSVIAVFGYFKWLKLMKNE